MNSEYENRQHNLKPGEVYMIRRTFKKTDGGDFSFYEWSHEYCTWFGCYESALAYVRRMMVSDKWADFTWSIVKMIPIPREKDGLEIVTFKGDEKPPTD